MIAVQLASFFLAVECLVLLFFIPRGLGSSILALLFLIFILIFCWTVRASDDEGTPT
ncbi:hypothetical protein [Microbacterium sp. 4-7]|uniref:hypothetical protein n=1 Tax=Microbacterium sp. 4-7 TaxID=1885327 RepID=UPI0016500539|nr:hypothetical protein [Microbacterium sp. 4-7]